MAHGSTTKGAHVTSDRVQDSDSDWEGLDGMLLLLATGLIELSSAVV